MKLQQWRKKRKIRQQQLADLLGVSAVTISKLESGNHKYYQRKMLEDLILLTDGKVTPNDFFQEALDKSKKI
jgi:transcriptional regulator with XRE-family HTH domain